MWVPGVQAWAGSGVTSNTSPTPDEGQREAQDGRQRLGTSSRRTRPSMPLPPAQDAERRGDVERGVLDLVVDHVVERLEIGQLRLELVHPADHLASDPARGLGEGPGLVPHQDHQVLALLGQAVRAALPGF